MSSAPTRRIGRALIGGGVAVGAVALSASPAAAHTATGALPAPSWLLGYGVVAVVLITAVVLRSAWPTARIDRFHPEEPELAPPAPLLGGLVGLALLVLMVVVALAGPNSSASNLVPWAVPVVFWVGLPLLCVLLGDVFRWGNPFVTVVRLLRRRDPAPADAAPPSWIPAAFLFAFAWYLLAYYRPGSPRALATFLVLYSAAAIGLGLRWGPRWLATGEGFGALSATVARLSPRGARGPVPPGAAALMVVWLGSTAFDVMAQSTFWTTDVLLGRRGWGRTLLDTVGLIWMTAIVAGLYLAVVRVAERDHPERLGRVLGIALVPLATGWFLAHDLGLLLVEGQNAVVLASDPFAEGWDLFGTIDHSIDYSLLQQDWLGWTQVALLAVGHVVALIALHDTALTALRRRAAALTSGAGAVVLAASAALGVLVLQ